MEDPLNSVPKLKIKNSDVLLSDTKHYQLEESHFTHKHQLVRLRVYSVFYHFEHFIHLLKL